MAPLTIPSLKRVLGPDMRDDALLCPVRALRYYIDKTMSIRGTRTRLFIAHKKGHKGDIVMSTVASWLKKVIIRAYQSGPQAVKKLFFKDPHAHQLRSLASSWAAAGAIPLEDIMRSCQWKSDTTFTNYYLCDLSLLRQGMFTLGPVVAAQTIVATTTSH